MKTNVVFCCGVLCLILIATRYYVEGLLFSQYTLMQVVFCVSWPIPYKNPMRKLFFNIGFQFNYGEPYAASNFYNATYYKNIFNSRDLKTGSNSSADIQDDTQKGPGDDSTSDNIEWSEDKGRMESRSIDGSADLAGSDLTAGQLYESIEDNFQEIGYDRSCLKKAICDLARHPFHKEDEDEHLLMDVINFVLTPTKHNGFAEHERFEREHYEAAQKIGENGHDCDSIYPECENSILNKFSYILS